MVLTLKNSLEEFVRNRVVCAENSEVVGVLSGGSGGVNGIDFADRGYIRRDHLTQWPFNFFLMTLQGLLQVEHLKY